MKRLLLLPIACLLLGGCSATTLYDRQTGHVIARFQGDMVDSAYSDGSTSWKVGTVNHSTATTAGGDAFANGVGSFGDLGLKIGMARAMGSAVGVIKTVAK